MKRITVKQAIELLKYIEFLSLVIMIRILVW